MKIIEFNVGALAEEGKSFESCINLMEQVHQEMSIAIRELSVSQHSAVLTNKNELIRIQRDAAALKTTLSNLKNVLSYAGDLYWNTELAYQKRINGEWAVVDKPFYESKGFKFVAGAVLAIGAGAACVVFSVPAIVVGIGVAVGVAVCAFTVYTAHKIGTELDEAFAEGVFKGTKETALLIGTGVFAGKVVQLGMKASLIQNVGTKLSQISAINNPFFKCLALDKMEDMIADGADDLLRGDSVSISLINPLIKELAKGNLALTPGKAIGLFQLALTGKRSQLDNVDFAPTSSQLDHVLDEGLETGDLNRLDEVLNVNLNQVDDTVEGISNAEKNTAECIKNIINSYGYSVDEFAQLLHPDRVLSDGERILVDSIRREIGLPSTDTLMCKTIPQSDIYKYLYNQYDGVRGFTAVEEHGTNLKTLVDKYNGARLDYNNTAFKITSGVDGISQSVGLPDKFYGTIEYRAMDVDKISIPNWKPKPDDYPYTGKAFTGSTDVVLPEYFQDTRKFVDGDIIKIINSKTGNVVQQFIYDMDTDMKWVMIGGN